LKNKPRKAPILPSTFADLPIKRKLMIIIMTVTTVSLAISGVALVASDWVLFREYLKRDLTALAAITIENSTAALSFEDPGSARDVLTALRARTHVVLACIYRPNGEVFADYRRSGAYGPCPPPGVADDVGFSGGELRVSRAIVLANRRIGTLLLVYDLAELDERMRLYGASVVGILLLSTLLAFLLSSRLRQVIATPISELATTAGAVSETRDYSIRARKLSRDELGVLVAAFNSMLDGIQSRDQELRQALVAREDALRQAQSARDFLRTTLASIGDAVISTDAEGKVVFANAVACGLMRWAETDAIGRNLDELLRLVNEHTRTPVENPVRHVLRDGKIVGLANHTVLIARDGTEVPIDDSAAPIRNRQGDLVGVVLIFRDITERKRAEQQLRSAQEQLQLVTDTMAPAVSHCGRGLQYLWVSRRYAEWLERSPHAIAGQPIIDVIGPEALATIGPYIERVLAGERVEYEAQVDFAAIGQRWIRAIYVPTHDPAGAVTGWVADVADITALKNAQAEVKRINADLQKTNEQLARSNEDLERFAFAASHDLQEPLRMVTTYVQLLVRTLPADMEGEAKMFVRNIVDGSMRMRGLLGDLLAYSEIGGETGEPRQTVNLNAVLESVRQNLNVAVEESGAEVLAPDMPVVAGHPSHFVQLFQNLIGNAIKYRGDEPPRIEISWERDGRQLQFAVSDNGMGIDPQYHGKIFGVFKRLHGKKIPGTGIGLAICQRVVERYHGRIWVESQVGSGATFFFTLPVDAAESEGGNQ
jgi:PAS domain S-box-containing protein